MPTTPLIDRPIFILGPGRSGTTLLRSLLSAHSRIAITPETHFMARAQKWGLARGAPKDFERFWKEYTAWTRFRELGVEPARCRELIELQGDHSFRAIFRAVLGAYGEREGKPRIGEKTPGHSRFLPELMDWFPDARVLVTLRDPQVTLRDPRAVVASQLKTQYVKDRITPRSFRGGWLRGKREQEVIYFARNWTSIFHGKLAPWQGDTRFHVVPYERLVREPERELQDILSFVGEPFESEILNAQGRKVVPTPSGLGGAEEMREWRRKHHARSRGPITVDSLEKWKGELTSQEVTMIERCCEPWMRSFGYTLVTSRSRRATGRVLARTLGAAAAAEAWSRRALRRSRKLWAAARL